MQAEAQETAGVSRVKVAWVTLSMGNRICKKEEMRVVIISDELRVD